MKRRELVKCLGLASALASLSLPLPLLAQQGLSSSEVAANIHLISGAGSNVLVAVGSDAVVVVDGGLREHAEALLAEVERLAAGKPIAALFNTNWRPEHVGLNHLLGPDTRIIAHENTRLWQSADPYVEWEDRQYQPLPKAAQANDTFYESGSLTLGDETLEYGYLQQAHTDGDIYVRFVQADVLFAGDLLAVDSYPILDYVTGGWVTGAQRATDALLDMTGETTKVIAAQGGVYGQAELQAQAELLAKAYEHAAAAFKNGRSLEDFKATQPQADFGGQRGDAELFLKQLYRGTWLHVPGRAVQGII